MKAKLINALKIIGAVIMALMVIIATVSVLWRTLSIYISGMDGSQMFWANELQQLMFHWVIVIGTVIAYENRSQLNITVFYSKFKRNGKAWVDGIFNVITVFVFSIVLIWGTKLAASEMATKTPALELSRGIFVYAPYVIMSAYIVLEQLYELICNICCGSGREA